MSHRSFEVQVEPSVMRWARESAGRTIGDVASKLNVDIEFVNSLEAGDRSPTITQLRTLSAYYRRSLAVFFLATPPAEPTLPNDFRNLPGETAMPLSSKTRFAMRRARRLQSIALELGDGLRESIFEKIGSFTTSDDAETLAENVRKVLEVELRTQFGWKKDTDALNQWIKSIEALNILVFQMSMPIQDARAFSLVGEGYPVIVLNTKDVSINARIFSLFHELGHILLNKDGICDPGRHPESRAQKRSIEFFCNRFAGAILVPKNALLKHNQVQTKKDDREWSNRSLQTLSNDFKVSQEVILRRLLILELTTNKFYNKKRQQWKISEERQLLRERKGGRGDIAKKCIQQNGAPIISLVLNSYRNKKITQSDVVDYLGVRLKYLPTIEKVLEA